MLLSSIPSLDLAQTVMIIVLEGHSCSLGRLLPLAAFLFHVGCQQPALPPVLDPVTPKLRTVARPMIVGSQARAARSRVGPPEHAGAARPELFQRILLWTLVGELLGERVFFHLLSGLGFGVVATFTFDFVGNVEGTCEGGSHC